MICVYDIGNENFDNNGDAVLTPTSTTVKQVAGGNYDISLEHPMDAEGKWSHLVPGAIVKAPVPREVIENSFSGVEADVYRVTEPAQLREDTVAPHTIVYDQWSGNPEESYQKGDKVTFDGNNYEVQYYDDKTIQMTINPEAITWYKRIANRTEGAPVLVSLNTGDELYYIEDANENWYKMSTFYGVVGYIPKNQVTYDRHVTPSESKPRIITEQLFRLQDPVIDNENKTVKVTGKHVSYDLAGDMIKPISIFSAGPAMMMGIITGSLMYPYRGTVATNMSSENHGTYTGEIKGKNGMFALLDPDKGLVSTFDAKFTRDNWDLFVMEKEDTDRGYRIRYGVNARGISWKKSSANLVTRVVPVAKNEAGDDLYLPEVWIDSEYINDYPVIMMEQIKVDGQVGKAKDASGDTTWTESALLDEMREKAEERFSVDHADQIYQEVTIQIELVEDTAEYAWLKGLKDLLLYDVVTAIDERTGLDKKLYVSELEYDSIRKRITGIKLTNIQDYDIRTVTGFNVKNNSIGPEKLTDEVTRGLVNQAISTMPQYADPEAKRPSSNIGPNTRTDDGVVAKGQGNANKVWGTDGSGNPGWVSPTSAGPNTKTEDGIVTKGQGNANKVWGTDGSGNPGWVTPPGGVNYREITSSYTYQNLLAEEETTFFSNWTDATNFPSAYGSGYKLEAVATSEKFLIYMSTTGKLYTRKVSTYGSGSDTGWLMQLDTQYSVQYAASAGNADMVDNKHASDFVAKAGDTMTGNLTVPNLYTDGGIYTSDSYHYMLPGAPNRNYFEFHEYGGDWRFYKQGTLINKIMNGGFEALYNGGTKAKLFADSDGGNLQLINPNGNEMQIDGYDSAYWRAYTFDDNGNGRTLNWRRSDGRFWFWEKAVADDFYIGDAGVWATELNNKLSITEIASNTTIVSMCQNAPADIVSEYRLLDTVSVSDYPSAMTAAGGINVRYISIRKHGGVGYVTITACNNAGTPFNICGYRLNDSIYWGPVF